MKENKKILNINQWPSATLIVFTVTSLIGSLFMLFSPQCSVVHGDGYAMGTDPMPVAIGRSCSPPLIDRLINTPSEGLTLLVVFVVALLSLTLASLMSFKILNFRLTKKTVAVCLVVAAAVAVIIDTLLLLTLYLLLRT